ncbi:MAG: ATP-binding protein [Reichenbachiella sp.]|uniref:ATP-binding protein n=1 Tax=Reichenbachiella sp. TaxID=2184521 RepID=UPI003263E92D
MTEDFKDLVVCELNEMASRVEDGTCKFYLDQQIIEQEPSSARREVLLALQNLQKSIEVKKTDVGSMISELNQEKELAEQAGQAKADFLSMISHEIRTPLNAIIGIGHILMNQSPREDQLTYIKSLRWSGETLLALINDVLDFNKIEAGKVEFESTPFNVLDSIQGVKESLIMKAHEQNNELVLRIQEGTPSLLIGDPTRLVQILNNLLSNAIKFTKKGCVRVDVDYNEISENQIEILVEVSDTGVGIAEDKIKEIFNHFSQADSRVNRQFGGTGLGLTITKQLVELQGGCISVESEEGVGSVFKFRLPFQIPEQSIIIENASSIRPNEDDIAGMKVLVVEDIAVNRLVVEKFLIDWGVEVDLAENGKEAIHMIIADRYDLVLMDLQMPVMDGFTASSEIRRLKRPKYQKLPIVALTAAAVGEIRQDVYDSGMTDIVTKPINPAELYKSLLKHGGTEVKHELKSELDTELTAQPGSESKAYTISEPTPLVLKKSEPLEEDQRIEDLLDFSYFHRLAGEDQDFFYRVVDMSADAFENFKIEYRNSFENMDFEELSKIRHKIVASLNNLKIVPLLELMEESKEIQKNEKIIDKSSILGHLENVEQITDRVLQGLRERHPMPA